MNGVLFLAGLLLGQAASAAVAESCAPALSHTWVRAAPPGVSMMAAYAEVRNDCAQAITIVGAESRDFASVGLHETITVDGVARMRAAGPQVLQPGERLRFRPGGSHLMLMQPRREFREGDVVGLRLVLADGRKVYAEFPVQREPPPATEAAK